MVKMKALFLAGLMRALLLLAACGSAPVQADLQEVYRQISDLEESEEMILLSEKRMKNNYGIDPESCPQAIVAVSGDGLRVDEVWLIEAAGEQEAKEIEALAQSRIQQVCFETESYLPDQYNVAKLGRVVRIGNYVGMFIAPNADDMEAAFRKALTA